MASCGRCEMLRDSMRLRRAQGDLAVDQLAQ
jgi:hypothetical protein